MIIGLVFIIIVMSSKRLRKKILPFKRTQDRNEAKSDIKSKIYKPNSKVNPIHE